MRILDVSVSHWRIMQCVLRAIDVLNCSGADDKFKVGVDRRTVKPLAVTMGVTFITYCFRLRPHPISFTFRAACVFVFVSLPCSPRILANVFFRSVAALGV
jgi:hypothetical protein